MDILLLDRLVYFSHDNVNVHKKATDNAVAFKFTVRIRTIRARELYLQLHATYLKLREKQKRQRPLRGNRCHL